MKHYELTEWRAAPYYPYAPFRESNLETDALNQAILPEIPCRVPGSLLDAVREAGFIDDPMFEMNSLKAQWISGHWWVYRTSIRLERPSDEERLELVLEGVDYRGHIFFNNRRLGSSENMYVPFTADITELVLEGENSITVVLENAPDEMGQVGYTRDTYTQKARFNYKWDWCTRLISVGLYRPAYIRSYKAARVKELYFKPIGMSGDAEVYTELCGNTEGCTVSVSVGGCNAVCGLDAKGRKSKCRVHVDDVRLWNPVGLGEQKLYELTVRILRDGEVIEAESFNVGFRHFELTQNDDAPIGALGYVFTCNGKRIYVKGVNLTPIDMFCYNDPEKMESLLRLVKRANINLIRVWGGGVIEDEIFYELCDRMGIMVWQEFIQSSSGIDNSPSEREDFLINQAKTAGWATKARRNHPSLVAWSGGNELMDADYLPSDFANRNIGELLGIVTQNCPHIPLLPASASGPTSNLRSIGEHWDVHGDWTFMGVENHYTQYNGNDSLFHTEFGVDGMTYVRSLEKFLSRKQLVPSSMKENHVWRHHGEWWDSAERDSSIFGKPDTIERQVGRSQYIQAEGLRYIIEANRRRAFQNSGSIIWQINEPYPNICCTSLIDAYMETKPAFWQVKKAFAPLNVSLKYDKLVWEEGEEFFAEVYVSLDGDERNVNYSYSAGGVTEEGCVLCGKTHGVKVGEIKFAVSGKYIDVSLSASSGELCYNNKLRLLVKGENGICDDSGIIGFYPETDE